jgi:hypothetical protein
MMTAMHLVLSNRGSFVHAVIKGSRVLTSMKDENISSQDLHHLHPDTKPHHHPFQASPAHQPRVLDLRSAIRLRTPPPIIHSDMALTLTRLLLVGEDPEIQNRAPSFLSLIRPLRDEESTVFLSPVE